MAHTEERFHNFKRPVDSVQENKRFLGILNSGVYSGFDVPNFSGLTLSLDHGARGIVKYKPDHTSDPNSGVIKTTQGVIVAIQTATDAMTVSSNVSNPFERWDLVVYEHEQDLISGGADGFFGIIEGTQAKTEESLSNPETQTIIGRIEIPAGATNLSAARWVLRRPLGNGGLEVAFVALFNQFQAMQQDLMIATPVATTAGAGAANRLPITTDANSFIVDDNLTSFGLLPTKDIQIGTKITLFGSRNIGISGSNVNLTMGQTVTLGDALGGYVNVICGAGITSIPLRTKAEFAILELIQTDATSVTAKAWKVLYSSRHEFDQALALSLSTSNTTDIGDLLTATSDIDSRLLNIEAAGIQYTPAFAVSAGSITSGPTTLDAHYIKQGKLLHLEINFGFLLISATALVKVTLPSGMTPKRDTHSICYSDNSLYLVEALAGNNQVTLYKTDGNGTSSFGAGLVNGLLKFDLEIN